MGGWRFRRQREVGCHVELFKPVSGSANTQSPTPHEVWGGFCPVETFIALIQRNRLRGMILCIPIRSGFQFLVLAPFRTHAARTHALGITVPRDLASCLLAFVFVHKQPSRVSRVLGLALQDCPSFGCPHTTSDYPVLRSAPCTSSRTFR